jgi:hypothetical protein
MSLRWFDRRFAFDLPAEMFPFVVERLRGTPAPDDLNRKGLAGMIQKLEGGQTID